MKAENKTRIFLVDDNIVDLNIGKRILQDIYSVVPVSSGVKLLEMLEKYDADLIILDIQMPEMNGYEVIEKLKENPETKDIPVIFLTGQSDTEDKEKGFEAGAVDYIIKPFSKPLMYNRIEKLLLLEHQKKELNDFNVNIKQIALDSEKTIEEMQKAILLWSAELIELSAGNSNDSSDAVQQYLRVLLEAMRQTDPYAEEMKRWEISIDTIVCSSALHDIGHIGIPDNILTKLKKLDEEEYAQIKEHTAKGNKIINSLKNRLSNQRFLDFAQTMAFLHHERWDGTGYPLGLKGDDIPLLARAMAIVDVYDALTSNRAYREALSHKETLVIIEEGQGTLYDPGLVSQFLSISDEIEAINKEKKNNS